MTYYSIKNIDSTDNIKATVFLNSNDEIFKGHFPGMPILPGVCMIQLITKVLENATNIKLKLQSADNIKFLNMLNPMTDPEIHLDIALKESSLGVIRCSASIKDNERIIMKFSGTHVCINHIA